LCATVVVFMAQNECWDGLCADFAALPDSAWGGDIDDTFYDDGSYHSYLPTTDSYGSYPPHEGGSSYGSYLPHKDGSSYGSYPPHEDGSSYAYENPRLTHAMLPYTQRYHLHDSTCDKIASLIHAADARGCVSGCDAPTDDEPAPNTDDEPSPAPTDDEPSPTDDEPVEPTDDEPVEPTDDEPVEPTDDEPVEPTDDEPVEPTDDEPAPTDDEPAPTDDEPAPTDDEPEEEEIYVTEEKLEVKVPAKLELSGMAPPEFVPGGDNEVFDAFVDVMLDTLTEIMEPPEGAEIEITHINGVPVDTSRRLEDASGGEAGDEPADEQKELVIDFNIVMIHTCEGECDDNAVTGEILDQLKESNDKLVTATSEGSSVLTETLKEKAEEKAQENPALQEALDEIAAEVSNVVVVPFTAPDEDDIEDAVKKAEVTQTMSDGSTNTISADLKAAGSTIGVSLATIVTTLVAVAVTIF